VTTACRRARHERRRRDFTLAYIARATTAGELKYLSLGAEDMREPETAGRTAIGKLVVAPR
jgi:hypothetical protein